jgi:hypothetical protein
MKLTREQIEQMAAGPEMDWLIATEIFKAKKPTPEQIEMIKVISFQFGHWNSYGNWAETLLIEPLPKINEKTGASFQFLQPRQYSTDIAAAWLVVEKLKELGLIHTWDNLFAKLSPWKWFVLSTETFCLHTCRAALIATLEAEQ